MPLVALVAGALVALPAPASAMKPGKICRGGVLHPVGTGTTAFAAIVRGKTTTYKRPHGKVLAHFGKLNQNGYPTTFSVVGAVLTRSCAASWYRVKLPIRPNGVVGYVRPRDVLIEKVKTRIEVDISARRLSSTSDASSCSRPPSPSAPMRHRRRSGASTSTSGS